MPVYIIRAGEHGPCKIGFSNNVVLRLVKMQADNHERLTVLRIFEGGTAEEAQLHALFADNRLHGEWHSFTKAMLGDVGLVEILPLEPEPKPTLDPTPETSIAQEFGDLTRQWRARGEREPPDHPVIAGEFVGIFKELEEQWRARREAAE